MAENGSTDEVEEKDFKELKERCKIIFEADPSQTHTDSSLRRFLRAFGDVDPAFKQLLKCNKWRHEYGVENLSPDDDDILREISIGKIHILRNRDSQGRPVIYVIARKHNVYERDIDKFTKFIVYILETACKKCNEEIIDNLCIIFDLKNFSLSCMDYQFIKNLIWLLSKYYPERLGICLIINSPMMFSGCWAIIRPWLNEVTARKVTFVSDIQQLCQYIHPDALPPDD
ncbi:CRAL-TRIO domain-containing protein C3H8.02-like [Gigantopelta aegis]|uniref:CRAL-TRIO domain-containing protein C3H8.02-like n=1 Tax=Gigantopelta aegis TaxID=1735272 RepID=UPI001B8877A5|nr:CRAL-TRIO domain-containing protein C3H8.02-like [Gigantopelta aegis]XP_041360135.1 CRAL-TRIO domain-containing protein C3H8.02-like [Gigantopelta aegis]